MNKTILFSPVGGTDPISISNCRDGSLLHICRVYKPDKVILYMSGEIWQKHQQDNRYLYCLERLEKLQNRKMEYSIIERPELKEVQDFDLFYNEFRSIIKDIFSTMDSTDELLLNVSSGTPGMKSALFVLRTLDEFPCATIQVTTPEKGMNEHIHKGFNVEELWRNNKDNEEGFENRCKKVECPTLSEMKKKQIIKKHIEVYDYSAALSAAKTLSVKSTEKYLNMLKLAEKRLNMDLAGVDKIAEGKRYAWLPLRLSKNRKCLEYAINLNIKLKRYEYADFIRAITPLVFDLFCMILEEQCQIDIDRYCIDKKHKGKTWSKDALAGTQILKVLQKQYSVFKYDSVYSDALKVLIQYYSKNTRVITLVNDLRDVEGSIRNLAAHQIISVTDETIKKLTGFTGMQIMDKIKELFNYTGMNIKNSYWDSYDEMNKMIIDLMD